MAAIEPTPPKAELTVEQPPPRPSDLSQVAATIVRNIQNDTRFLKVIERERGGNIAFCPRCGQKPWRDYRFEEAFTLLHAAFPNESRSSINLAIEWAVKVMKGEE